MSFCADVAAGSRPSADLSEVGVLRFQNVTRSTLVRPALARQARELSAVLRGSVSPLGARPNRHLPGTRSACQDFVHQPLLQQPLGMPNPSSDPQSSSQNQSPALRRTTFASAGGWTPSAVNAARGSRPVRS